MPLDIAQLMKQVRSVRVVTGRLVDERFAGEYHSVFRGAGIEFDEVRQYVPGDDVRAIDWNVTARMGRPFVKRFREERQLTVLFVVDVSGSLSFGSGTRSKAEVAAEATCLLALSAIRNQDKVGLVLFSDRIEKYIPARKGRTAVMRLVREVLAAEGTRRGSGTNIGAALRFINKVRKRRAVVFLMSDFMDRGYEQELQTSARRHDVICCVTADPRESRLTNAGLIAVQNPETGERALLDTGSAAVRREFATRARQDQRKLQKVFQQCRTDSVFIDTTRPFIDGFRELFRARRVGTRGG